MSWIRCLTAWVLLSAAGQLIAQEPSFQFRKKFEAKLDGVSLVAITIDAEIFDASQSGLSDLRLFDAKEATIPYLIRKPPRILKHTIQRQTWAARQPKLQKLDGNGVSITLTLDEKDPSPNGLKLITPLKDFEQQVKVLQSKDGETWTPLAQTVIFDYSKIMDVRNDSISFEESSARYFRIDIDNVTSEQQSELTELTRRQRGTGESEQSERLLVDRRPFRIDQIEFWHDVQQDNVASGEQKRSYPVKSFDVKDDSKSRRTFITVETHREPLTSLELKTTSRNFGRRCTVEVQQSHHQETEWISIGNATISIIDFKSLHREQLSISIPETRQSQYRILIENQDSPPLEISGVNAEGNVYEMIALCDKQSPDHILFGSSSATTPNYDTSAIRILLQERKSDEIVHVQPGLQERIATNKVQSPPFISFSIVLTVIIGLLVVILGWCLYRAALRIDIQ